MTDQDVRTVTEAFWAAVGAGDWDVAAGHLHQDFVQEWPQSGERIGLSTGMSGGKEEPLKRTTMVHPHPGGSPFHNEPNIGSYAELPRNGLLAPRFRASAGEAGRSDVVVLEPEGSAELTVAVPGRSSANRPRRRCRGPAGRAYRCSMSASDEAGVGSDDDGPCAPLPGCGHPARPGAGRPRRVALVVRTAPSATGTRPGEGCPPTCCANHDRPA